MTLLTPTAAASARLAGHAQSIAGHLASAAAHANAQAQSLLALDDAALAAWLNAQAPADVEALFAAHATVGAAINGAAAVISTVLAESGVTVAIPAVDTRPVADKLATQRRAIAFDPATGWAVTTEPLPEVPAPDPEV